jgi:hypothetical protein
MALQGTGALTKGPYILTNMAAKIAFNQAKP